MEMNSEIWGRLPEELLILVLAKLPTLMLRKFRAVCKQWKSLLSQSQPFQWITHFVQPSSASAFLIGRLHPCHWINSLNNSLYLLQPLPNSDIYRLSIEFLAPDFINVVAACKSVLCCSKEGEPTLFYVCNPVTETWKKLPPTSQLRRYDFIGLTFDAHTGICILVIGGNQIIIEENNMVVEIYESQTNAWTKLQMNAPKSISPWREGVYSRGRFYWINSTYHGIPSCGLDVVALDIKKRCWDVIRNPTRADVPDTKYLDSWQLTGYDGKVFLVYRQDLVSVWGLNESDGDERWSEMQELSRMLCEEVVRVGSLNDFGYDRCPEIAIHSNGSILLHLPRNKIVLFDREGRKIRSFEGRQMTMFTQTCPMSVRAFEINNVWWP